MFQPFDEWMQGTCTWCSNFTLDPVEVPAPFHLYPTRVVPKLAKAPPGYKPERLVWSPANNDGECFDNFLANEDPQPVDGEVQDPQEMPGDSDQDEDLHDGNNNASLSASYSTKPSWGLLMGGIRTESENEDVNYGSQDLVHGDPFATTVAPLKQHGDPFQPSWEPGGTGVEVDWNSPFTNKRQQVDQLDVLIY
ncbi:unnamed protein product [Cylindrotheca closterium]|uniref:Uncharacterized protein n=1 Tax=Cylindrotheca closterium TaxID=2856 RepID=A0AAD2CF26_9STRA|nr:unnamed protein product [Cylindrotheca closterium]